MIVQDHPLATVVRSPPLPEHLLGRLTGRRSSLELTRSNRLLDQRAEQVRLTDLCTRDLTLRADLAGRVPIDLMQQPLSGRRECISKDVSLRIPEFQWLDVRLSRKLDRQPPLFQRQVARRCQVA